MYVPCRLQHRLETHKRLAWRDNDKPFFLGRRPSRRIGWGVYVRAAALVLGVIALGGPVQAQNYVSPGGLSFGPSAAPANTMPQQQAISAPSRTTYAVQSYSVNNVTGAATPATEFDFGALVADMEAKLVAVIGQVMPLFLKILMPVIGVMLVLKVVSMISKG